MTDMTTTDPVKARHHALWALGDYDRIAALLGDLSRDQVAALDRDLLEFAARENSGQGSSVEP
jgi:hypothetical protein